MIYKITKLGSVENPYNKNSAYGESMLFHLGIYEGQPIVGERFNLSPISYENGKRGISTSAVTKIIDENTFETMNSVYKIEKYEQPL